MQVLVSCVLKTIQLRPKNCKGAHSRVPYRAATLKQYQLLLWGRLECHVMHKVQAIALRSDKHTVETKLRSPYSVISSPFARWSYAHNRIGVTVISRLRLHWHLSKSSSMSLVNIALSLHILNVFVFMSPGSPRWPITIGRRALTI